MTRRAMPTTKLQSTGDNMTIAMEILNEIIEHDLIDDRREYEVTDLMNAYEISKNDAQELFNAIQTIANPET